MRIKYQKIFIKICKYNLKYAVKYALNLSNFLAVVCDFYIIKASLSNKVKMNLNLNKL